jgi:hypothetical protein
MTEAMYCYRHPKRQTRVTCSTCDRPICTECMRTTPVGVKCPDDARLPRGARVGVMKPAQIAKTFLAGLAVVLVGIPFVLFVLYNLPFQWLVSAAAGYGAGTLIFRAGGRNGGPLAVAVSTISTAIPFAVALAPTLLGGGSVSPLAFVPMLFAVVTAGLANRRF